MQNLLPIEPYLRQARIPWRLTLVIGAVAGVLFQAATWLPGWRSGRLPAGELPIQLLWGLVGGLVFALLLDLVIYARLRFLVRRTYEGTLFADAAPPTDPAFTHRLVATLDHDSALQRVAGTLYAGRGRLRFVPQRVNLGGRRGPWDLPVDATTTFESGERQVAMPAWTGARPLPTLTVRSGAATATFQVPDPETAARRLDEVLFG